MTARGIRNNNPGNIVADSVTPWQGLDEPRSDGKFFRFKTPAWGIRALARVLITYQDRHSLRTVREIVTRWAPPHENDTEAYIKHVRQAVGVTGGQVIDVHRFEVMKPLVEAIILHENGEMPYSLAQVTKGLVLAGVEPPMQSLQKSRTVKGGQIASAGVTLSAVAEGLQDAAFQVQGLSYYLDAFKWVFIGLTVLGIAIALWARVDDSNKGLR